MKFMHPNKWSAVEKPAWIAHIEQGENGHLPVPRRFRFSAPPSVPDLKSKGRKAVVAAAPASSPQPSVSSQHPWRTLSMSAPPFLGDETSTRPKYNPSLVSCVYVAPPATTEPLLQALKSRNLRIGAMMGRQIKLQGFRLPVAFPHAARSVECVRQIEETVTGRETWEVLWVVFDDEWPPKQFNGRIRKAFRDIVADDGKEMDMEVTHAPIPTVHEIAGLYGDVDTAKVIVSTIKEMNEGLDEVLNKEEPHRPVDYWNVVPGFDKIVRMAVFLSGAEPLFRRDPLGKEVSEQAWAAIITLCNRIASVSAAFAILRYHMCGMIYGLRLRERGEEDAEIDAAWDSIIKLLSILARIAETWVYDHSGRVRLFRNPKFGTLLTSMSAAKRHVLPHVRLDVPIEEG